MNEYCCKQLEDFLNNHDGPLFILAGTEHKPPSLQMVGYRLTPSKKAISLRGRAYHELVHCPFCGGIWN